MGVDENSWDGADRRRPMSERRHADESRQRSPVESDTGELDIAILLLRATPLDRFDTAVAAARVRTGWRSSSRTESADKLRRLD